MKRWALLTALLYALALLLLTVPVVFVTLGKTGTFTLKESAALYGQQGYWLWLAILVAGQILLLLVPVDVSQKRLPSRRKLQVPVIVSAFFLGNLCFAGIFSVVCAILGDRAFDAFDLARLFSPGNPPEPTATNCVLTMVLTLVVFWLAWAVLFRRATRADAPGALADRLTRWLLRGSILELIIAVPCHVV
ncbi:MAG TPA: hypothetical protein VFV81_03290, partial [Verrucomicrobiae bacterium]|nr:hypothetical protein [Verrucomicrobiae bacterium]